MSRGENLNPAKAGRGLPPVWSARERPAEAPEGKTRILQFEGFGGGVPPNTETAAVNPRVGIAR